ncbi:hypothetical protein F5Y04DRAFT_293261 [Hypomontagnella monticulosa]|nr:hypothetical protein F5Y04DRAFT_293261 [Hypomontagnella monticulosa]
MASVFQQPMINVTESFTLFPLLPKELRDKIWDSAIRPDQPGAHFFSVVGPLEAGDSPLDYGPRMELKILEHPDKWDDRVLAAPGHLHANSVRLSWEIHNPSLYMYDSGLWSACKESRDRMEWRFESQSWDRDARERYFRDSPRSQIKESNVISTTGCFRTRTGMRYFTMYPHQDLLCLQSRWKRTFQLCDFRLANIDVAVPFLNSRLGFRGPRNIAIEFDPAWASYEMGQPSRFSQGLIFTADHRNCRPNTIWFIDYRIRRQDDSRIAKNLNMTLQEFLDKKGSPGYNPRQDRRTFLGVDRIFIEGYENDNWYQVDPPTESSNSSSCPNSVTGFIQKLKHCADTIQNCPRCGKPNCGCSNSAGFRFLICEQLVDVPTEAI